MDFRNKVVVVTGGARGIGAALCEQFVAEGAVVVAVDLDGDNSRILRADVASDADMKRLVDEVVERHGRIDVFCNNAGIMAEGGVDTTAHEWDRMWKVNAYSHVVSAQLVLPGMLARGEGCFLQTVSAAGLLTMVGSAPYAITKHAAMAFAEWLAITYGDRGIRVAALCPLGVKTDMLGDGTNPLSRWLGESALTPRQVAAAAIEGLKTGRFLITPHAQVREFFLNKATDYDRWIAGMRKVQKRVLG